MNLEHASSVSAPTSSVKLSKSALRKQLDAFTIMECAAHVSRLSLLPTEDAPSWDAKPSLKLDVLPVLTPSNSIL
jgi:hypothetical protein